MYRHGIPFALATLAFAAVPVASSAAPSAPLPHAASAYSTAGASRPGLTFVISAGNPKVIESGQAALGSNFAISGGFINCPKAPKNPGFQGTPFTDFGFPHTTLKLHKGKYGFSISETMANWAMLGGSAKPFAFKVAITGQVVSSTTITGTVKASGGPCTTKQPLKYKAKLNSKTPVAPGK